MYRCDFNSKCIYLAELKYNDERGIELSEPLSYGLLYKCGENSFINILDIYEELPIFKRVPYSNTTIDGEDYGTMVSCISENTGNGPCWVLTSTKFSQFTDNDKVTIKELEDYVLADERYFKDREAIAKRRLKKLKKPTKMVKIILSDQEKRREMDEFFDERIKGFVKAK